MIRIGLFGERLSCFSESIKMNRLLCSRCRTPSWNLSFFPFFLLFLVIIWLLGRLKKKHAYDGGVKRVFWTLLNNSASTCTLRHNIWFRLFKVKRMRMWRMKGGMKVQHLSSYVFFSLLLFKNGVWWAEQREFFLLLSSRLKIERNVEEISAMTCNRKKRERENDRKVFWKTVSQSEMVNH